MRYVPALLLLLATGCSWVPQWGVYKIDVNQGNYITKDMVDKLKPGQSKSQVRLILGTPLITSAFHANRWDYVYQLQKAGRKVEHRSFAVFFSDERLTRWEGDEQPPSAVYAPRERDTRGTGETHTSQSPTQPENRSFFGRLWDKLGF